MKSIHQSAVLTLVLTLGLALSIGARASAADYKVDTAHSSVGFSVKHMVISTVNGMFKDFSGEFTFDPETGKLGNSKFEVKTESIDTANAKRDEHLRSEDFFDAKKFPLITITNSKIKKVSKGKYEWVGDLNMHGVTKPVTFDVDYAGSIKDPQGNQRAAFNAKAKIKRSDWGLKWNKLLESGGAVVSDDVVLTIDIEALEAKAGGK